MATRSYATIDHGVLVRQWKWPLRVAFWWLAIAVTVWAGTLVVHWYWARDRAPEAPLAYSQKVLQRELELLGRFKPVVFEPVGMATSITNAVHHVAVETSLVAARALMNWPSFMRANAASIDIRSNADPGGDFVRHQLEQAGDGWQLMVNNTGLFAVRTATYLCSVPLLALGIGLGAADGLVARAKRKACAGHESASIYHRAKLAVSFTAITGYMIYMALPQAERPAIILIALCVAIAGLVWLQCKFYKKYL